LAEGSMAGANNMRVARHILKGHAFEFCDRFDAPPNAEHEQFLFNYSKSVLHLESLLEEGIEASTTDVPEQSIGNTLDENDETFWSSVGADPGEREQIEEHLSYKLKSPLCVVHSVQISVYRARYQFGEPIYPPMSAAVYIGDSMRNMRRCTELVPIKPVESMQVIKLPYVTQPIGGCLQIRFSGMQQMQFQDRAYYIAIRRVGACGLHLPLAHLNRVQQILASSQLNFTDLCSAKDVSNYCKLENGRTILEEMEKRLIGECGNDKEEKQPGPKSFDSELKDLIWTPLSEDSNAHRVYDFPNLV